MIELIRSAFNKKKSTGAPAGLAAEYNKTRTGRHNTFCHAPSVNMYFTQYGQVKVCCNNYFYTIGKYPEQSIGEIWTSPAAEAIREKMKRYDFSAGCGVCEYDYKNRHFGQVPARHFDELQADSGYPAMMEFLLTNTCNLECVMCRGENSSLIRKNREKLPPIVSPYGKEFLQQLEPYVPHLKEARFSGSGEAFSIDIYYDIWEMILAVNPGCLIVVQTNGTILSGRVKEMLEKGNFEIGVSIDSLHKETYEAIRQNARFEKVMANLQYFKDYSNRTGKLFRVSACVMRQNWREMPAYIEYCNSINAVATLHKVTWPREMALYNMTADELQEVYTVLSAYVPPNETRVQKDNYRHYRYFVSVVKNWLDKAPQLEKERAVINRLEAAELLPYMQNKIAVCMQATGEPDDEKEATLKMADEKIKAVTGLCNDNLNAEMLLRWMALWPAHEVLDTFKMQPPEYIFSEASRDLL